MTDELTANDLRVLGEREIPLVFVDEPHQWRHDGPFHPTCGTLHPLHEQVGNQYAALHAAGAATLIRQVFGPTAHRALIDVRNTVDAGTAVDLLIVFDVDGQVLWYDSADVQLWRSQIARDRAEIEAYGGPVLPCLDEETQTAIEQLAQIAEESPADGYFLTGHLVIGRQDDGAALLYLGDVREVTLDDELWPPAEILGTPAYDGSLTPQRRLLAPLERDITVRVLRDLCRLGEQSGVWLGAGDREVLASVATAIDPRDGGGDDRAHTGYISLDRLAEVLRDETAVLDPDDVPNLMETIRAAADTPAGVHHPRGVVVAAAGATQPEPLIPA
ncbi:hypothetical protein AB0B10_25825 [Micromonospora arborensis]|uniref:hypothetical protein n=1 Tax=Micromonospora arborensis TaxID=2116518 RepID=UPI0033DC919E